jgi:hypothetical protein
MKTATCAWLVLAAVAILVAPMGRTASKAAIGPGPVPPAKFLPIGPDPVPPARVLPIGPDPVPPLR